MIALLQRVLHAAVMVDGNTIASTGPGMLVLIGVEKGDTHGAADRLLQRLLTYRIFADETGRMNRDLQEQAGDLLLVPQFTLAADTSKGRRPGFSTAATPEDGQALFEYLVKEARQRHPALATGRFGAHMQVNLTNDGPVTFWLQVSP
jgi:D-tyrosyl-tRNA(Tyr) deacylase